MSDSTNKVEQLKIFLKDEPNDVFLNYALALEYVKSGLEENAKLLFVSVLKMDEQYLAAYYQLGSLFERKGDLAEAKVYYDQGMQIAKKLNNSKSYNEFKSALDNVID